MRTIARTLLQLGTLQRASKTGQRMKRSSDGVWRMPSASPRASRTLLARLRGRLSHTPLVRYRSSQYRAARLAGRWRAPRESPDPLLNLNAIRNAFASNRGDTLASRRGDVVPRL